MVATAPIMILVPVVSAVFAITTTPRTPLIIMMLSGDSPSTIVLMMRLANGRSCCGKEDNQR